MATKKKAPEKKNAAKKKQAKAKTEKKTVDQAAQILELQQGVIKLGKAQLQNVEFFKLFKKMQERINEFLQTFSKLVDQFNRIVGVTDDLTGLIKDLQGLIKDLQDEDRILDEGLANVEGFMFFNMVESAEAHGAPLSMERKNHLANMLGIDLAAISCGKCKQDIADLKAGMQ